MRILDRYIGGQVLMTTLFAVFVLCIVLVLGNVFKELFPKIADGMISPMMAVKFIVYILPFTLAYTIPWGFLTAVLLVFGRLSADSEFTAIRSSGVSFVRLASPVAVLALVFAGFCLLATSWLSPIAKGKVDMIMQKQILEEPERLFVAQEALELGDGMSAWVGERDGRTLKNLYIFKSNRRHQVVQFVSSEEAVLEPNEQRRELNLRMQNAYLEFNEHADMRQSTKRPMFADEHVYAVNLEELYKEEFNASHLTNGEIFGALRKRSVRLMGEDVELEKKQLRSLRFELQKRFSIGMACLAFGCVAVPLGVTSQRRETSVGFVISLVLALTYFLFIIVAESSRDDGTALPYVLLWLPNLVFFAVGFVLFWRLNRR